MRAVVCNQCSAVCTDETESERWWVLQRNIAGTGSGRTGIIETLASAVTSTLDITIGDGYDDDTPEPEPEPDEFYGEEPELHFCKSSCLASWAALAASVEPE